VAEKNEAISSELAARKKSAAVTEIVPESAIETPPPELERKPSYMNGQAGKFKAAPTESKPSANPDKKTSVEERNAKLLPGDPTSSAAVSGGGALNNTGGFGETLDGTTEGKLKPLATKAKAAPAGRPTKQDPVTTPAPSQSTKDSSKSTNSPSTSKTTTNTTPGGTSTTTDKSTKGTATKQGAHLQPAAQTKALEKKSSRASLGSATASNRTPRPAGTYPTAAGTAEKKAAVVSPSGAFHKPRPKSPTRPVKLPASLTTHTASSGSKGTTPAGAPTPTAASTSEKKTALVSPPSAFHKPRPKSPTIPVKLPASLTTHTASSGTKGAKPAGVPASRQSLAPTETADKKATVMSPPSAFHKPRPKSPTIPVKLPASLTTHTASSGQKGATPAADSTTKSVSRSPSRTSSTLVSPPSAFHKPRPKSPTIPVKLPASLTAHTASSGTKGAKPAGVPSGRQSLEPSTKAESLSPPPSAFHKPRPKSPTRPVKLPASLTTHTASSGQKGATPAATSSSRQSLAPSTKEVSKKPSRTNLAPKQGLTRKPSKLDHDKPASAKPAPASVKKQPSHQSLPKQTSAADEGMLARMMKPTTSSASKTAEKVTTPPHKSTTSRPTTREGPGHHKQHEGLTGSPSSKKVPPLPKIHGDEEPKTATASDKRHSPDERSGINEPNSKTANKEMTPEKVKESDSTSTHNSRHLQEPSADDEAQIPEKEHASVEETVDSSISEEEPTIPEEGKTAVEVTKPEIAAEEVDTPVVPKESEAAVSKPANAEDSAEKTAVEEDEVENGALEEEKAQDKNVRMGESNQD
jgi:hypothetical protein